jgi:IS6 family transposase
MVHRRVHRRDFWGGGVSRSDGGHRADPNFATEPGHLDSATQLITGRGLNNRIEQDHRRIKRLVRQGLGFRIFDSARRTIDGYEAMAMIHKGQVRTEDHPNGWSTAAFIEGIFGVVA